MMSKTLVYVFRSLMVIMIGLTIVATIYAWLVLSTNMALVMSLLSIYITAVTIHFWIKIERHQKEMENLQKEIEELMDELHKVLNRNK